MSEHMPMMNLENEGENQKKDAGMISPERRAENRYRFVVGSRIYLGTDEKPEGWVETERSMGEIELGDDKAWKVVSVEGNPGEETMVRVARESTVNNIDGMEGATQLEQRDLTGSEIDLARFIAERLALRHSEQLLESDSGSES